MSDITYFFGSSSWHVVGFTAEGARLLCGWKGYDPDDEEAHGDDTNVALSQGRICLTCDRATGGQAAKFAGSEWLRLFC